MKLSKAKMSGAGFIAAALVCAALAALLVVEAGINAAPTVPVLEVTQDISAGDYVSGKVKEVKIAKSSIPKGAIKPGADLSGAVAKHGLSEGDILRASHLIDGKDDGGLLSARLMALGDKNLRAVELPIESASGMMRGMKAGDRVDVIAVREAETASGKSLETKTILTNRELVGVMMSDDGEAVALVVSVTPQEAEILASSREQGKVYVSLRPFGKEEN